MAFTASLRRAKYSVRVQPAIPFSLVSPKPLLFSASVVGLEGNDVINFGAQGKIVTGSGSIGSSRWIGSADLSTGKTATGTYIISAAVMASSRVSTGKTFTYGSISSTAAMS